MRRPLAVVLPARRRRVKDGALSRCGLEVGKLVRQALIRRVWRGDVKYARRLTHSRTVIVLDHDGEEMAFLYSSVAKDIVSFLPRDAEETADWRRLQPPSLLGPGLSKEAAPR